MSYAVHKPCAKVGAATTVNVLHTIGKAGAGFKSLADTPLGRYHHTTIGKASLTIL
jgi:hypothetical protein